MRNDSKLQVTPEAPQHIMMKAVRCLVTVVTLHVMLLRVIRTQSMVTKTARCDGGHRV
jgi:hypothetical protein